MEKKPYHHGELKKALIENGIEFINQYGEEKLSLRKVAEKCGVSNAAPYAECKDETQILSELGVCYVMFFYHNPLYFDFLFSRKSIQIRLSSDNSDIPPFELFRRTAKNVLGKMGISEENVRYKTTAMWALVHGLAALSAMPNIDIVWESEVRAIINSVDISDIKES